MISYADATQILSSADPLKSIDVPTGDSIGHVTSRSVHSPIYVPSFANSAMDGFAVRAEDCQDLPVRLDVTGYTAAGDAPETGRAFAWEIMTGGPVPSGYDSVIKVEDVETLSKDGEGKPKQIRLSRSVNAGGNIRHAGEDFKRDDVIIDPNVKITSQHLMALAAVGCTAVNVAPKPRVSVISTGNEVVDDLSTSLKPGQIYNSNAPYLLRTLSELGTDSKYEGVFTDDATAFETHLKTVIQSADLVVSTGAVSAGRFDFIPNSLKRLGAEIVFHKVAIRPGKPILYARFPNGTNYLGLPGNPISAAVGLRFFGVPLIRAMTGLPSENGMFATLSAPHQKSHSLRFFAKAILGRSASEINVSISTGQQSFKIGSFLTSNCWAVVQEDQQALDRGDQVLVYPLIPDQWSNLNGKINADQS